MKPLLMMLLGMSSGLLAAQSDSVHHRAPRFAARGQFAGMQGIGSGGLLWNLPDGRLQLGALYGHSPAKLGANAFHGAALRVSSAWFPVHKAVKGRWTMSPTLSITTLFELGGTAWFRLPPEFPDGYYGPNAIHALLAIGGRAGQVDKDGGWIFTMETVALDTYLWYSFIMREVPFHSAWSLALGAEYHFGGRPEKRWGP